MKIKKKRVIMDESPPDSNSTKVGKVVVDVLENNEIFFLNYESVKDELIKADASSIEILQNLFKASRSTLKINYLMYSL